jgi:hypothetical protein
MSAFGSKADIAQGRRDGGLRGQGQPWFRHRIRLAFDTDRPEGVIDPEDGTLFGSRKRPKRFGLTSCIGRPRAAPRSSASLDRKRHSAPFWPTQGRKH